MGGIGRASPRRAQAAAIVSMRHVAPAGLSPSRAARDQAAVVAWIEHGDGRDLALATPPEAYNPYPLAIAPATLAAQRRLQQALVVALRALVSAYADDPRISETLTLEPAQRALILAPDLPPWRLGVLRPDLLHDRSGRMRVCEINARFAVNGYFMTAGATRILREVPGLDAGLVSPCPENDGIERAYLDIFSGPEVAIIKGRESGYDVHILQRALERDGRRVRTTAPGSLVVQSGRLADGAGPIEQALLELHQSEIEALAPEVQAALARVPVCLNDLRTVLLVHDKRMLALLSSRAVLADHVAPEVVDTLLSHVLPTRVVSHLSARELATVLADRAQWILKPNLFGKGEGIVFGKGVDDETWAQALTSPGHAAWIVQPYIDQPLFDIVDPRGAPRRDPGWRGAEHELAHTTGMHVVGTLLSIDDRFLGPGIYRASPADIVAVSHGGYILAPALTRGAEEARR